MILEKLDFLSPKITLFYKYKKRHSSQLGGVLTLVMFFICLAFILKFLLSLFVDKNPSVFFYRKYEKDLSNYTLAPESIAHLIWLKSNNNEDSINTIINTKAIRVILLADENNYEANTSNLVNYEHWVYDSCEKNAFTIYEDIINNDEYINKNEIINAICIKYYYNNKEKRYYSLNDINLNNGFKYPYLEHSISNKKNTILSTIIEKCNNNSITKLIFGECENEDYIQKYLNKYNSVYIQILDHQVDITNFDMPIQSYFMGISSLLLNNNGYEVNDINFSPLLIKSSQNLLNLISNNYIVQSTVIVDNTHSTIIGISNNILLKYLFHIQNYKQIYQRKYKDIVDAFSSIGGIIQFFYYVFYLINYFYNDFILILNTQNLFLNDKKGRKMSKLISFNKIPNGFESKVRNNTLMKNYESSNILQELQFYKLVSKDNTVNNNDFDISSIHISESNNDKDSRLIFNRKKERNIVSPIIPRRSQQLNYNNILKFRLKEGIKRRNGYRNSMFSPNNIVIAQPSPKFEDNQGKNYTSNFEESKKKSSKFFDKFKDNNYSKNITLIDNRDRKYSLKNNENSFAENVKLCNYLKNKRESIKLDNENTLIKNDKKEMKNNLPSSPKENKYYSEILNFKEYINFKCSIKNKRRDILIIQKFRTKLLSEEHFYKSHLFIYLIVQKIKIDKDDKSDIKELYSEL